jgi:tRNA-splicing ligase RtcB
VKICEGSRVPVKSWCNNPEESALEQALNLASLPFVFKHVALMPDTHAGNGMPIGGVVALKNVVCPNMVGVDIGCGMSATRTGLKDISREALQKIKHEIQYRIPVGFKHNKQPQTWEGFDRAPDLYVIQAELESAKHQLGTLGGGNHFIEIQRGSDGYIWYMLHSGSRNFGLQIAKYYNNIAQKLCEKWHSNLPRTKKGNFDLAFLPVDTEEGKEYIEAMNYGLEFAKENRRKMSNQVEFSFSEVLGGDFISGPEIRTINIHHNYASVENHFGHNVWVHRKGATSAKEGEFGIIPGSQGSKSYIVCGKGNPESFMSCSHGAGRKLPRKKAIRELDLQEEIKKLNDLGVLHSVKTEKDLDESPSVYKDIDIVMEEQKDLVDIDVELTPLAVIKG